MTKEWIPTRFSPPSVPDMSDDEKIMQKALGTYPKERCPQCHADRWVDDLVITTNVYMASFYMCKHCILRNRIKDRKNE